MNPIEKVLPLGFPWPCLDPFLFCVHHVDHYPAGDGRLAPAASMAGRQIGQDFSGKDGFSMYHGERVPGFPQHPHRGFETVSIVRQGLVDHSDSLGAAARFGRGDTQWLTAGAGIVHSEMFPLLRTNGPNPTELFQIWLNLPKASKMAKPHFKMLWDPLIPALDLPGGRVRVIAGEWGDGKGPHPPPESWASDPAHGVTIQTIQIKAGGRVTLPPHPSGSNRVLYYFKGSQLTVGTAKFTEKGALVIAPDMPVDLMAGDDGAEALILGGWPIGEPVVQYGPFVLNDEAGIRQAFADYQKTGFGGWPWRKDDPTHGTEDRRFARYPDGTVDSPES